MTTMRKIVITDRFGAELAVEDDKGMLEIELTPSADATRGPRDFELDETDRDKLRDFLNG